VTYDSIYPEFFRTGVGKLQKQGARNGDYLGLFSAMEQFRREIADQREVKAILQVAEVYVAGLDLFGAFGFFLSNPATLDFELAHCAPAGQSGAMDRLVRQEIRAGRFAWALRQNRPAFFTGQGEGGPLRGVLHTLGVATHRLGMFCGVLKKEQMPSQEITFSLLSILLGASSDALGVARTTEELQNKILAAHENLQRALRENEVLARISAESPNPIIRLHRTGRVLYGNQAGSEVLQVLGWQLGDLISGEWMDLLTQSFDSGTKQEFEAVSRGRVFTFLIVPVAEAGYANFYATDITARKEAEAERERLIRELKEALAKVKTLSGLVPICAWCKKIRDDQGFWKQVEVFIQSHSDAVFTHGVCPDCMKKFTNELEARGEKAAVSG
jgi:PAS domain-containing protein